VWGRRWSLQAERNIRGCCSNGESPGLASSHLNLGPPIWLFALPLLASLRASCWQEPSQVPWAQRPAQSAAGPVSRFLAPSGRFFARADKALRIVRLGGFRRMGIRGLRPFGRGVQVGRRCRSFSSVRSPCLCSSWPSAGRYSCSLSSGGRAGIPPRVHR
jgi:hypothetical protein